MVPRVFIYANWLQHWRKFKIFIVLVISKLICFRWLVGVLRTALCGQLHKQMFTINIDNRNHSLQDRFQCFPITRSPTLATSQSFIWNSSLASDKSTFVVMQQDILHLFYISQSSHPCINLMKFNEFLYNSCKTWMKTRFRFHDAGRRKIPSIQTLLWQKFVLWIASNNSENGEE